MDNIEVIEATAQPGLGIVPSHKITISQGSDIYVYWYVKQNTNCRDFDILKDKKLVELMYSKGREMNLGIFETFQINNIRDYHLERRGSHEFIIKSLN